MQPCWGRVQGGTRHEPTEHSPLAFGVAAVLAASMAPFNKRGKAVSRVLLGVTAAILVGAPGATYFGQIFGWRSVFAAITVLSLTSLFLLYRNAPEVEGERPLNVREELASFANPQVWLALAIASIGFSGMFGVYSYLAPMILNVTKLEVEWIAPMLVMFGLGTLIGNYAGGALYDRFKFSAVKYIMVFSFFALFAFPVLSLTLPGTLIAAAAGRSIWSASQPSALAPKSRPNTAIE